MELPPSLTFIFMVFKVLLSSPTFVHPQSSGKKTAEFHRFSGTTGREAKVFFETDGEEGGVGKTAGVADLLYGLVSRGQHDRGFCLRIRHCFGENKPKSSGSWWKMGEFRRADTAPGGIRSVFMSCKL